MNDPMNVHDARLTTTINRKLVKSASWRKATLAVSVFIATASMAFASSAKLSTDLQGKHPSGQVDVIVQFDRMPAADYHQKVLSRGGRLKGELGQFKGAVYTMPVSALADLESDSNVVYISPDRPLYE
jgi:hypothetical protein